MKPWQTGAIGKKFVASYSGGKDSTLALHKAVASGDAVGMIVMMEAEGQRSRAHGMSPELLEAQAEAIGIPLYKGAATWESYEPVLKGLLREAKAAGAEVFVTGDIDVPEHECWHERVTGEVGLGLGMPLWQRERKEVVKEFIDLGFVTKIVTVNLEKGMTREDLGRLLTHDYVAELEARGIDPCGESGEFHTTVIDGPLFKHPIAVEDGEMVEDGRYIYLNLKIK